MSSILFWIFAALTLGFGAATLLNRNPVASALCLVVSLLGLSALFFGLEAYFIAVIQILVYAGAVMVLFLFIIMLLDIKAQERRPLSLPVLLGGAAVIGFFVSQILLVLRCFPAGKEPFPALAVDAAHPLLDARNIGITLFSAYNLPFQVIGVLILVASIGVVVLSKRELK
ncbi:MAG: NADH-quinone oxidoreductase subunit J [Chthoniobacteraceae bacterium]|nr:NADH-quinone oxidoreductase subunit J [Chthoniobacteraceae bacterium]